MQGDLEEDFAALRKLRDDDASGELKEAWTGEDPREWSFEYEGEQQPCVEVTGERVTGLALSNSSLVVLSDAIGELGALTTLFFLECSSLAALPAAIGELGALTGLNLRGC